MTATLESLRRHFGGELVQPGTAGYDAVRRSVFAAGTPAYVLPPKSVEDVRAAVRFAAGSGLSLSVRGGGHAFAGFGTNEGGVVIDLRNLAQVEILDAEQQIVRIGGGATWGQVATALAPHGLAISAGDTKSVGVGGLTLTGGIGWKVRKYGLALDNVVGAEIVTADGEVLRVSAHEHPELFWAIRGGGGNFGIVTAFDFAAHKTTDVFFGRISFPVSEAAGVLHGWAEYMRVATEDLTSVANVLRLPGAEEASIEVHVVFDGDDQAHAAAAIDPIRRLGTVLADDVALTAYADTMQDGVVPPEGFDVAVRSAFVESGSVSDALRIVADAAAADGSPAISLRSIGAAVARVPRDATAYAHRSADLLVATLSAGPGPVVAAAKPAVDALWARLAPHANGAYGNFLSSATDDDVAAIYPVDTAERLTAVKRRYDPANLFAHNHNVRPEAEGSRIR
jgi:FAD/FMN-containing dehydrogenase